MNLNLTKNYTTFAIIITNIIIIFILVNIGAYFYIQKNKNDIKKIKNATERLAGPVKKYGKELFIKNKDIYGSNYDINKILDLMNDYYYRGFGLEYEPFVGYREKIGFRSEHINISKFGYRFNKHNVKEISKTKKTIFVFGGSTTFGYGVSDSETIPSYLQDKFDSNEYIVYNFGRGYYYSKQQLILFIQLLNKGYRPDIVISIDGVNEKGYTDIPSKSNKFSDALKWKPKEPVSSLLKEIPIVKLYFRTFKKEYNKSVKKKKKIYTKSIAKKDIEYYLETIKMFNTICEKYDINYYAIYQPSHIYKFDYKKYHPFYQGDNTRMPLTRYPILEDMINMKKTPKYLYSLMDLQENEKRPLYVDLVHYNPYFNNKMAEEIYKIIKINKGTIN